jgi:hypothetical protein
MTTRKPKPSLLSTMESPEERLQLITITVKPKRVKVSSDTAELGESPSTEPVVGRGKRRLH